MGLFSKMNSREKFDKNIIEGIIKPRLKEEGFKKSGLNWINKNKDIIPCFNIQFDRSTNLVETKFTYNLGIFSYIIYQIMQESVFQKDPKEFDCFFRERIGMLLPSRNDTWYIVRRKGKDDADNAINDFINYGLPYLNEFKSYQSIIDHYFSMKSDSTLYAILLALIGENNKSNCMFERIIGYYYDHINEKNNQWFYGYTQRIWDRTKDQIIIK